MTRTETELATTIAAAADVVVDTDAFVTTVKYRARRRRRVQFAVAGAGTAVAALAVAVPVSLIATTPTATTPTPGTTPWAPRVFTGNCTIQSIPTPLDVEPGLPIQLTGMDPTGRYITGSYGPAPQVTNDSVSIGGPGLPVLWDNGIGRVLPVSGDGTPEVNVIDVNRHGSVVGSLRRLVNGTATFFGWVSMDGIEWDLLPTPDGYREAYAVDINDRGEIVGVAHDDLRSDPVLWSAGDRGPWIVRVIEAPNWNGGGAVAITDDGMIVGTLRAGQPYAWDNDGAGRALPLPDGTTWGNVASANGDWAVGTAGVRGKDLDTKATHLLRWNLRTRETSIVDTASASPSAGAVVNSRGDVVWNRTRAAQVAALPDSWNVLRTHDGEEYELPNPPDDDRMYLFGRQPVAMSDDATLIAGRSILWRC